MAYRVTEAQVRYSLIDPQLRTAGWNVADHKQVGIEIPCALQSFSVKKVFKEVKDAWRDDFWNYLTTDKLDFLRLKVEPLLRFVPQVRPAEEFFTSQMERCGLEALPSDETVVRKAFDGFILEHNCNADQSRFLRVVQSVFLQRRKIEAADLYDEPFSSFGLNAVDKLFS